ncbi:MAG TPA: autotransporter-associated beta strand repeat-containing protein [Tepidisphaeraceae bacterium]|nr:autotransporter-associated beta strand repeat-containing protein [Tepidisphaeraceae bacterium]
MSGKNEFRRSASRALAIACAAALSSAVVHADSTIYEYQFTADTFNPTHVASNLVGSAFEYTNANPGYPPLNNPPFIVQGGIDPDDPAYFVAQGDWYPAEDGLNENYYTFNVSVAPGFILNASSFSVFANARQAVLFDSQVAYSTSSNFSNPVNFDTTPFLIPAQNVWNTFTASDAPIANGTGTYYFRIYGQFDPNGSGSISDLLNMGNISLVGAVQTDPNPTNMYWDPANIGSSGSGGTGTWTGTTPWADGAIDYAWSSTIAETANFGGASGGNVALGGNVTALYGMNFTTSGYNITGNSGQTLTVGGTITTSDDATISAAVNTAATGTLTKAGTATLTIAGSASFASGTALSVTGGTLKLVADVVGSSTASISSGAVLEYNDSANTFQTPITYSGAGTLRETGSGNLIFGAFGDVNVDLSAGGLIDVEGGTLTGSSSYGGIWTSNQGSLNIAADASFNAVESGLTGTMQIDALNGAGSFLGGYFGVTTVTLGVAGGSGLFSGSLQDNPDAQLGIVKTGNGTETFTGSNSYSGGTNINSGKLIIGASGAMPDSAVVVQGTGDLMFASGIGGVTIQALTVIGSGRLDLTNNHLYIDYGADDPVSAIRIYLTSGYNGGTWNGIGIDSSSVAANPNFSVGYADYADPGNPAGLVPNQLEVKYTLAGDTNLDGIVNSVDFGNMAANFGKSGKVWDQGDFDYDGVVNSIDFGLLAGNFGKSVGSNADVASAADWAALDAFAAANGLLADVPEPASASIFVMAGLAILSRRRRRGPAFRSRFRGC